MSGDEGLLGFAMIGFLVFLSILFIPVFFLLPISPLSNLIPKIFSGAIGFGALFGLITLAIQIKGETQKEKMNRKSDTNGIR